jgi:hypothetical protein
MNGFNAEQMKQLREMCKPKTSYERFVDDVMMYLDSKLKDYSIPKHTFQELAEYIHLRTVNYARDEWDAMQRRELSRKTRELKRRFEEGDNGSNKSE